MTWRWYTKLRRSSSGPVVKRRQENVPLCGRTAVEHCAIGAYSEERLVPELGKTHSALDGSKSIFFRYCTSHTTLKKSTKFAPGHVLHPSPFSSFSNWAANTAVHVKFFDCHIPVNFVNDPLCLSRTQIILAGERVPIMLVGNKSDLIAKRQVSQDMAMKLAQESMHNCQYLETSAKYNVNVSELFVELLQQACTMEQQQPLGSSQGSSSVMVGSGDPGRSPDSPMQKSSRKLSHRLGSLGSLPSMRRKSSATSAPPPTASPPRSRQPSQQIDQEPDSDQKCRIL